MAKKPTQLEPIGEGFDDVMGTLLSEGKKVLSPHAKVLHDNDIDGEDVDKVPIKPEKQLALFKSDIQDDIAGMGVLENGAIYNGRSCKLWRMGKD